MVTQIKTLILNDIIGKDKESRTNNGLFRILLMKQLAAVSADGERRPLSAPASAAPSGCPAHTLPG
jgi:hypothetical protein